MAVTLRQFAKKVDSTKRDDSVAIMDSIKGRVESIAVSAMQSGLQRSVSPTGTAFKPPGKRSFGRQSKPLIRSGTLYRSLKAKVQGTGIVLSADAPGAKLQNEGGTVRAKGGGYLTIPLTAKAADAGSPRNYPGSLFFMRSRNNKLFMREAGLKNGAANPSAISQYLLVKSVTVPKREFLGLSDDAIDKIVDEYAEAKINAVVKELNQS